MTSESRHGTDVNLHVACRQHFTDFRNRLFDCLAIISRHVVNDFAGVDEPWIFELARFGPAENVNERDYAPPYILPMAMLQYHGCKRLTRGTEHSHDLCCEALDTAFAKSCSSWLLKKRQRMNAAPTASAKAAQPMGPATRWTPSPNRYPPKPQPVLP